MISKPTLIAALVARGFQVVEDSRILFQATKTYDTACGPREASVCIFSGSPNRVDARYDSEGRNILDAESFLFSLNPEKALEACEQLIERSYARSLWHLGIRPDNRPFPREAPPRPQPSEGIIMTPSRMLLD